MYISDAVQAVINTNAISIDVTKNYNGNDMLALYESVIVFLNNKLLVSPQENDTTEEADLERVRELVMLDITTCLPQQLTDIYSREFFEREQKSVSLLTAQLLIDNAVTYNYPIQHLWEDVIVGDGFI